MVPASTTEAPAVLWVIRSLSAETHHGGYVRFVNLARAVGRSRTTYLAILDGDDGAAERARALGIFHDVVRFSRPREQRGVLKHLRTSNIHFVRRALPDYFHEVASGLRDFSEEKRIGTVVGVTIHTAEFLDTIPCTTKVLDDYDCVTLTLERYRAADQKPANFSRRIAEYVHYLRIRNLERSLTSRFDLVTTISAADQERLQQLSRRRPEAVRIIKNGVDPELVDRPVESSGFDRAIAFWGNFSFAPNAHAVLHFYRNVFKPYLEGHDIRWFIVGPNVTDEIHSLCAPEPEIELAGFVPDLARYLASIPIMINPMISGSGLKNKVLEAFAMKKVVVSTAMGAAAIEADPGIHYVEADEPDRMAQAILDFLSDQSRSAEMGTAARDFVLKNYQWTSVGEKFLALLREFESPK